MPKICLSYRRSDSAAMTGRIFDRLVAHYGRDAIFIDIDSIPYGVDFREHIQTAFKEIEVLLVIVGPDWLGASETGPARIQERADPVRVEVETALEMNTPVIPVLVGAQMPGPEDLPHSIRNFAFRNALRIDAGVDFTVHTQRLIRSIDQLVSAPHTPHTTNRSGGSARAPRQGHVATGETSGSSAEPTSVAGRSLARLAGYVAGSAVLLLLAHYLIVMKMDLSTAYLRLASILIPFGFGFLLYWELRYDVITAVFSGLSLALLVVAGMLVTVGLVDSTSVVPSTLFEWQESIEYFATIALGTLAGHLAARISYSRVPPRFRPLR